jgi:uncharacterized protein with GYD domain
MATYISLIKLTQQGGQTIKDSPARVEQMRQLMQKHGVELKSWHLTMGRYDIICTVEAPDDETAARFALTLGLQGNAKTETLRAFSLDDFKKLVGSLPG